MSLIPSVRRTSGCRSHFIVWRNQIWWCSRRWDDDMPFDGDAFDDEGDADRTLPTDDLIKESRSALRSWREG